MRGIILGATEEILKATATFDDDGQTGSKLTTVGCARGKETKQEVWGGVVGGAVWCVALHRLCEYSAFGMNTLMSRFSHKATRSKYSKCGHSRTH